MEEDIKILEEKLNEHHTNIFNNSFLIIYDKEIQAIENLLKRYKELEEENESLVRQYEHQGALMVNEYFSKEQVFKHFIPISVIQNKIDEYREKRNKLADGHFWDNERNINEDTSLFIAIETLKLLLEERNK